MMRFREFIKLNPRQKVDLSKRKQASNIKMPSVPGDKHALSQLTPTQTITDDETCGSNSNQDQPHGSR